MVHLQSPLLSLEENNKARTKRNGRSASSERMKEREEPEKQAHPLRYDDDIAGTE